MAMSVRANYLTGVVKSMYSIGLAACVIFALPSCANDEMDAKVILQKSIDSYSTLKSYRASWSFSLDKDGKVLTMANEVKSKGKRQVYFHVYPKSNNQTDPGEIPELLAVIDGKTAWFELAANKTYYKVDLPKDATISPLLFFPSIAGAKDPTKKPDGHFRDRDVYVIVTEANQTSATQVAIDKSTMHIAQFVKVSTDTGSTATTTITIDKEEYDKDISDKEFTYKPPKGFKEVPAPPDAAAIFGKQS